MKTHKYERENAMNDGVFCKPKSSTEVSNSILIDEYHKCIFGEAKSKQTDNMNTATDASTAADIQMEEPPICKVGMNMQAPFISLDNYDYYEAVILKIYDDKFAVIKFLGYDDEQIVKLDHLRCSKGKKAIEEQIATAKEECEQDEDEDGEQEEPIIWKIGMPCRAYYEPNDIIYEGTIESINYVSQRAVVSMTGYNIKFVADFCDLYKSDPSLREKQIRSAAKHAAEKNVNTPPVKQAAEKNDFRTVNQPSTRTSFPKEINSNQCPPSQTAGASSYSQGIMQPKDENEALACLVSANYLCGYYAGYYDSLKRVCEDDQKAA